MNFNNEKPIYLQIADYICSGIVNKKWVANNRVPSTRELAIKLEVNPNTVIKSYSYLVDLNIIYNKRGIGYMVQSDALDNIISEKKLNFMQSELQEIFKTIDLLSIDIKEIIEMYHKYKTT